MAKLKVDLQSERKEYVDHMESCRGAHNAGNYTTALELANSACDFIDGMMQFEHRFEGRDSWTTIESIDYVLCYSPLTFEKQYLDRLAILIKSQRRIQKNMTTDLTQSIAKAISIMHDAYRLWNHIEVHDDVRQDDLRKTLGGDQDQWRWIAETWVKMGIVHRIPESHSYRLQLVTRLNDQIRGKCPHCGVIGKATKHRLLDAIECPKCHVQSAFVLLSN
jgi:hypothetical protein